MKINRLQGIDHRRHQGFSQREGRVVLRVAADLNDPFTELGKGRRQVRRGRAFADTAFAIDGKDLGLVDLDFGI